MMLLAALSLTVPSTFSRFFAPEETLREEALLNIGVAVVLLAAYALYLVFMLRTHPETSPARRAAARGARRALEPAARDRRLVARVAARGVDERGPGRRGRGDRPGARHVADLHRHRVPRDRRRRGRVGSAIAMARRNKMDLSVGIALGSCIQIALFVAPVLVLASYFVAPQPLELSFTRAEIGALFMAVLIGARSPATAARTGSRAVQLIAVYLIIALMFYFMPHQVVAPADHSRQRQALPTCM